MPVHSAPSRPFATCSAHDQSSGSDFRSQYAMALHPLSPRLGVSAKGPLLHSSRPRGLRRRGRRLRIGTTWLDSHPACKEGIRSRAEGHHRSAKGKWRREPARESRAWTTGSLSRAISSARWTSTRGSVSRSPGKNGPAVRRWRRSGSTTHRRSTSTDLTRLRARATSERGSRRGGADFCLEWDGTVDEILALLKRNGVVPEAGPGARTCARNPSTSVYFRDPD